VLTVVNMSLASPRSAGENTLDMLEIMTRAFDEGEGGGCTLKAPGACANLGFFNPYWADFRVASVDPIYEDIVEVEGGLTFFVSRVPAGFTILYTCGQGVVGLCRSCVSDWLNQCCQLDIDCCYNYDEAQ